MLKRMASDYTVGVYGAAALVTQMADLLAASILTVFLPRFSRYTETAPLREQVKSSLRCSILFVAPLIPCYFLIEPVIGLLLMVVGEAYAGCIVFIKIMYFGVLFTMLTHPLHILFYARGRPHVLTLLDGFMLVFIATGHYFAISRFGPAGAAVVVLVSRFLAGTLLSVGVLSELSTKGDSRGGSRRNTAVD
jgi:O-antigen/teichoic acid export membrane protein